MLVVLDRGEDIGRIVDVASLTLDMSSATHCGSRGNGGFNGINERSKLTDRFCN